MPRRERTSTPLTTTLPVDDSERLIFAPSPAWEKLGDRYVDYVTALNAESAGGVAGSEVALFTEGGGERVGIAGMQDSSPEGLAGSGGAMAVFTFPVQEIVDGRSAA